MRLFWVSFFAFLMLFIFATPASEGVDLYQWRGYVRMCLTSEVIGSGCSEMQTEEVFDTKEECETAVPEMLEDVLDAFLERDPDGQLSAQWYCAEDRSVFNA